MSENPKKIPDLLTRSIQGTAWVFGFQIFVFGLSFLRYFILANLLSEEDFGLFGIGLLLIGVLEQFSQTGVRAALIQKSQRIDDLLNSGWTLEILRSILLFLMLFLLAPYLARLRVPSEKINTTVILIRMVGLCILFHGFTNIGTVFFDKELRFKKQFILGSLPSLIGITVSILHACWRAEVWALVSGRLASDCCRCIFSFFLHSYRPKVDFRWSKMVPLLSFGKWIYAGTILSFLVMQGDDLVVWGMLGVSSLGIYRFSYQISNMPLTHITKVISKVSFPAYSMIQDDSPRIFDAYLKVLKTTLLISVPLSSLIFLMANDMVSLFLKEQWQPAILPIKILAFYGLSVSVNAATGPVFQSIGKMYIIIIFSMMRLFSQFLFIFLLIPNYGLEGVCWAILLSSLLNLIPGQLAVLKVLKGQFMHLCQVLLFFFAAGIGMVIPVGYVKSLAFYSSESILVFFLTAGLCLVCYVVSLWTLDHFAGIGLRGIIQEVLSVFVKKLGAIPK